MEYYIVKKILNNNVVIASKDAKEFILTGKAIGFECHKGDKISESKIEGVFIKKENILGNNYEKILNTIDMSIVGISEEIISLWEKELNAKLNEAIHISLPDHINFAIRRIEKGIDIKNPFLSELVVLYPREYDIASKALDMINAMFKIKLPQDEIGFLCLHIRAASSNQKVGESLTYTKKIGEVMELIFKLLKKEIDKNSLEYARTLTHINFMVERVIKGKPVRNYLLDSIKKEIYNEYAIAIKIAIKIENLFNIKVPEDEVGYIALHLKRLEEL